MSYPYKPDSPAAKLKKAGASPTRTWPVAPPVYRPQPAPKALQPKTAAAAPRRNPPAAPPVYCPQPAPKVLQAKGKPGVGPRATPAPPASRETPRAPAPAILQRKTAGVPNRQPNAQPKGNALAPPRAEAGRPVAPRACPGRPSPKVLQAKRVVGAVRQTQPGARLVPRPGAACPARPSAQASCVQRAAARGGGGGRPAVVQRLVADGYDKLYATRQWLDTKLDDRDETIREVLSDYDKTELKAELLSNISESVGFNVSNVVEFNNPSQMADQLMKDASGLLWPKSHKKRQLKSLLQTALPDLQNVTYPPDDREISIYEFRRKQMLSPNHLVKAEDDLNDGFNLLYCCALIAVYKSEGKGAVKSKLKIVKELGADAKYYEAMHDYYYGQRNIQYDEPVTHPGIYKEWGFSMIHAGHTSWANLKDVLKASLRTGKKYIFDLDNHSVFVTMKKDFHPGAGPGEETFASFFDFHSDPNNFNTGELKQYVEYIYEK